MANRQSAPLHRFRNQLLWIGTAFVCLVCLPSIGRVRAVLIRPLFVHDEDATGDVAYVMADGYAYFERLRAAADLFHSERVATIYISDEDGSAGYDYVRGRAVTIAERAEDFLGMLQVPATAIKRIPFAVDAPMGSLSEAQSFAKHVTAVEHVVVITSAPHTRRSLLCFRRTLSGSGITPHVFAASQPYASSELHAPIWLEYLKLGVYYFFAR